MDVIPSSNQSRPGDKSFKLFVISCNRGIREHWNYAKIVVVRLDLVSFSEIMRVFVPALIKNQTMKRGTDSSSIIRGRVRVKGEGKDHWIRID